MLPSSSSRYPASSIKDIQMGREIVEVSGVITNRTKMRATDAGSCGDGPLSISKNAQVVFDVTMMTQGLDRSKVQPDQEILLFFYDKWAEQVQYLDKNDILTIWCPASMVHLSQNPQTHEHPCCVAFKGSDTSEYGSKVRKRA